MGGEAEKFQSWISYYIESDCLPPSRGIQSSFKKTLSSMYGLYVYLIIDNSEYRASSLGIKTLDKSQT